MRGNYRKTRVNLGGLGFQIKDFWEKWTCETSKSIETINLSFHNLERLARLVKMLVPPNGGNTMGRGRRVGEQRSVGGICYMELPCYLRTSARAAPNKRPVKDAFHRTTSAITDFLFHSFAL
ncbi:hypothetical protein Csa_015535 [Cucumis sativus]|uniref:Uncharacterized protein n=1 Tax=Cucumis sativus TaxID=3659 RepID=A0A0A0K410_CUCSA|nr:hypothetical protein Csa_015535 [Cucumis sativus]